MGLAASGARPVVARRGGRGETKRLLRELEAQGFIVEKRKRSGHWMVKSPDGVGMVTIGGSVSSRGLNNTVSELKKIGYQP